jgi:hypothetical protein
MQAPGKPTLSGGRIAAAFAVAIVADGLQLLLGPLGWWFFDEAIDVVAMILTITLLGFHPLLLPTFVLELLPVLDLLPTWTGCVAIVVTIRRKQQRSVAQPPAGRGPVIDV